MRDFGGQVEGRPERAIFFRGCGPGRSPDRVGAVTGPGWQSLNLQWRRVGVVIVRARSLVLGVGAGREGSFWQQLLSVQIGRGESKQGKLGLRS